MYIRIHIFVRWMSTHVYIYVYIYVYVYIYIYIYIYVIYAGRFGEMCMCIPFNICPNTHV